MSEAGAEPGRYVGVDAVVLAPAGLGSAVARGLDFGQNVGPVPAAAAAGLGVMGVRELAAEAALATVA